MLSFIITGSGRISAVANGQSYSVGPDHPKYNDVKNALNKRDAEAFINLVDIPKAVAQYSHGSVKIVDGVVYHVVDGKPDRELHNTLTTRMLWMLEQGFEIEPLIKFLDNLMQNPSRRAVQEHYTWLEYNCIPITEDGCWLGYKKLNMAFNPEGKTPLVPTEEQIAKFKANPGSMADFQGYLPGEPTDRPIFKDVHSGTIRQWMGGTVEVDRNTVDEDWGRACSEGLHVGASTYGFSGNVYVMVKVNPRDTVSVPSNEAKCRVCKYEIVKVVEGVVTDAVVGPNGEKVTPSNQPQPPFGTGTDTGRDDDDDFEDDDDDNDDVNQTEVHVVIDGLVISDARRETIENACPSLLDKEDDSVTEGNLTLNWSVQGDYTDDSEIEQFKNLLEDLKFVKSVEVTTT